MKQDKEDRLNILEKKMARKKNKGSQLFWITFNPGAEFDYDVSDATEDVQWMIFEIKRLKEENKQYKEFVESYKKQVEDELFPSEPGSGQKK